MSKVLKILALVAVSILAFVVAKQSVRFGLTEQNSKPISIEQVEANLKSNDTFGLFKTIEYGFPQEFQSYLEDMVTIVNDPDLSQSNKGQKAFEHSKQFTTNLRRDNAQYLLKAPIEDLRKIQQLSLDILLLFRDDKDKCNRVALSGLSSFQQNEVSPALIAIGSKNTVAVFSAISHGRDNPKTYSAATSSDYEDALRAWMSEDDVTTGLFNALVENDTSSEFYCEAAISYQSFLLAQTSPNVTRIIVEQTAIASSQ